MCHLLNKDIEQINNMIMNLKSSNKLHTLIISFVVILDHVIIVLRN